MSEFFYQIDLSVFYLVNHTLQNVVFDAVMPFLTDLNKKPAILVAVLAGWLWLMLKGGTTGRTVGVLLVITIAFSDQLNSSWIKHLFERDRPCHVLSDVHLLVSCGSGYSFPSSHAVNNFAGATVLAYYYRRWMWIFATIAATVAFSRIYVGVHYPFDVLAGAAVGLLCGVVVIVIARWMMERWKEYRAAAKESAP